MFYKRSPFGLKNAFRGEIPWENLNFTVGMIIANSVIRKIYDLINKGFDFMLK